MAILKIWEKESLGNNEGSVRAAFGAATQTITFDGTDDDSATFGAQTRFVHIQSDADCYVQFGTAPAASAADSVKLTAGTIYDFALAKRDSKISAVTA